MKLKTSNRREFGKLLAAASASVALVGFAPAMAQEFPTKPITIYVGYAPGDNVDVLTRLLADKASQTLGQPIVIENRPGSAGSIALGIVATAAPDGYSLASVVETPLSRLPQLRRLDYTFDNFVPVMQYTSGATGVVVNADAPWQTFDDLVADAKANPGTLTYATTGAGSTMHVAMQFVEKEAGLQWTHVPYPGARDTLAAVMGGHINAAVGSTQWAQDVKDGTLRLLAIIGENRMEDFPDVPTIIELGYNFSADSARILVAPASTPDDVVAKIDAAFKEAMDNPEYVQTIDNMNLELAYRSSEELKAYLQGISDSFAQTIVDLEIPTEF